MVIYILAVFCWSCPIMYEAASFSSFIEIIVRDYGEAAAAEQDEDKRTSHISMKRSFSRALCCYEIPKNTMFCIACHAWSYMTVQSRTHDQHIIEYC
ncbi:hypothetical protein KY289_031765 [Solanum tuberosum]|nr:hypothetical protein KY289_031765 [Solanum tuberosum]